MRKKHKKFISHTIFMQKENGVCSTLDRTPPHAEIMQVRGGISEAKITFDRMKPEKKRVLVEES